MEGFLNQLGKQMIEAICNNVDQLPSEYLPLKTRHLIIKHISMHRKINHKSIIDIENKAIQLHTKASLPFEA